MFAAGNSVVAVRHPALGRCGDDEGFDDLVDGFGTDGGHDDIVPKVLCEERASHCCARMSETLAGTGMSAVSVIDAFHRDFSGHVSTSTQSSLIRTL
jgi:hypothetical protein